MSWKDDTFPWDESEGICWRNDLFFLFLWYSNATFSFFFFLRRNFCCLWSKRYMFSCCTEGFGLVGTIGDRCMAGLGDLGDLFQPWWFYEKERTVCIFHEEEGKQPGSFCLSLERWQMLFWALVCKTGSILVDSIFVDSIPRIIFKDTSKCFLDK